MSDISVRHTHMADSSHRCRCDVLLPVSVAPDGAVPHGVVLSLETYVHSHPVLRGIPAPRHFGLLHICAAHCAFLCDPGLPLPLSAGSAHLSFHSVSDQPA